MAETPPYMVSVLPLARLTHMTPVELVDYFSSLTQTHKAQANEPEDPIQTLYLTSLEHLARRFALSNSIDWQAILELVNLDQNKLAVLRSLPYAIILQILYLLEKHQLINGLQLFSKERLVQLTANLPKELLLKMLLYLYSQEELMQMMPSREFLNILRNDQLDEKDLLRGLCTMPTEVLQQLLGRLTGSKPQGLNKESMLAMLGMFRKRNMMDGMEKLSGSHLGMLAEFFVKENPTLLQSVSDAFLMQQFSRMSMPILLSTFEVVPDDVIINEFLSKLPQRDLALVASQVDTTALENFMVNEQPILLLMVAAEMNSQILQ